MIIASFELGISYSQFAICDPQESRPFNVWTEQHVTQGFSWRKESACFRTLASDGLQTFQVSYADVVPTVDQKSIRAILAPAPSIAAGVVEVASFTDKKIINVPKTFKSIMVQMMNSGHNLNYVTAIFLIGVDAGFKVLKSDTLVQSRRPLLASSNPS